MKFFKDFFKGILIGAGAILPGISSGVLCVIFGIYESLLNCVFNFFKNIKQNFKFLFPLVVGGLVGIIIFGNILKYLFFAYPIQIKFIFIGLILGSIPAIFKEGTSKEKFKPQYLIFTLFSFSNFSIICTSSFLLKFSNTDFFSFLFFTYLF